MALLTLFLFIGLIGILCYHKANLLFSSLLILAYCLIMASTDLWYFGTLLLVAALLFPLVYLPVRRSFISSKVLQIFQKIIPSMSKTEKEAIEAGTTWWEGDVFQGMPDWDKLHKYPKPQFNDIIAFDKLLFSHLSHTISNLLRSFYLGITNGRTSKAPTKDNTRRFYQQLNRQSANLALLADISMAVLGGGLKRRERISARLGDILSHLYLASATLKRFEDDGRPAMDLPIVEWGIKDCLFQSEIAMQALLRNFPNRLVAIC